MRRTSVLLFISTVSIAIIGVLKPQMSRGGELYLELHRAAPADRMAGSGPTLDIHPIGDQAPRAMAVEEHSVLLPAPEEVRHLGAAPEGRRQEIDHAQPVSPSSLILRNRAAEPPHDWP